MPDDFALPLSNALPCCTGSWFEYFRETEEQQLQLVRVEEHVMACVHVRAVLDRYRGRSRP